MLAFDPFLFQTRRPSSSSAKEGQSSGRYRNHFDLQQFLGGNEFLKKNTRLRSKLISVQIFRREGFISAFTVPSYSPVGFPSSSSPSLPSVISYHNHYTYILIIIAPNIIQMGVIKVMITMIIIRIAIHVLTHPLFSGAIICTILVNCYVMVEPDTE